MYIEDGNTSTCMTIISASVDQCGRREQGARNNQTQRLHGFKTDDQVKLSRSLDGQLRRVCTFEYLPHIVASQSVGDAQRVGIVAHQATMIRELPVRIHRCDVVARDQLQYFVAIAWASEHGEAADDECLGSLLDKTHESSLEIDKVDFR